MKLLFWFLREKGGSGSPRLTARWALGLLVVLFFGLAGRLFSLQVWHHDDYIAQRNANSTRTVVLPGTRGGIYTEDGVCLAQTTFSGASLVINPRAVPADQRADVATRLAALLGRDGDYARELEVELYQRRDKYYYNVMHEVPDDVAESIANLVRQGDLPGVELRKIETRRYPLGNFASQIVGFVGRDMYGQEGVERALEKQLSATPGKRVIMVDALGHPIENLDDEITPAVDGANVYLTINSGIQAIVEDELIQLVDQWDPITVSVIVMETNTGAILGISNYPNYDPNNPGSDAAARKNAAITDTFEPGSMFKPLIVCSAYQRGMLTPDSLVEYTPQLIVPGRKKNVNDHGHEIPNEYYVQQNGRNYVTVNRALVSSSNTVMTRIGLMLGCENLHDSITGFGFGRRTGFDMGGPRFGESSGVVRPLDQWTVPNSIPSVSIGYEVQVTPMQMLNCFNAIANGGHVYKPWVIGKVQSPDGKLLYEGKPSILTESGLSEKVTRELMNETLKGVVEDGTATSANIAQYRIAGKTGTAMKVKNGQYTNDKVCSFVGYAPADNPVISVIVVVNEARGKVYNKWGWAIRHYGGTVAAPTMSRIVLRSLKQLGVPDDAPELPDDSASKD
ncbi:MAG: penicillin-binding protein 2 [Planctomycetes bacterium]|nr:penicillin-binding protein 2 [Planctomycetota bacterium]